MSEAYRFSRSTRCPEAIRTAEMVEMMATAQSRTSVAAARLDTTGLRRHQRHNLAVGPIGRARIGRSLRNRPSSSANSCALA